MSRSRGWTIGQEVLLVLPLHFLLGSLKPECKELETPAVIDNRWKALNSAFSAEWFVCLLVKKFVAEKDHLLLFREVHVGSPDHNVAGVKNGGHSGK